MQLRSPVVLLAVEWQEEEVAVGGVEVSCSLKML